MLAPSLWSAVRGLQPDGVVQHAAFSPLLLRTTDYGLRTEPNSREFGDPHQVPIALACCAAAFVDCPDDQALASTAVAGGEDAVQAGRELTVLGFYVAAGIGFDFQILEQHLLRA